MKVTVEINNDVVEMVSQMFESKAGRKPTNDELVKFFEHDVEAGYDELVFNETDSLYESVLVFFDEVLTEEV